MPNLLFFGANKYDLWTTENKWGTRNHCRLNICLDSLVKQSNAMQESNECFKTYYILYDIVFIREREREK